VKSFIIEDGIDAHDTINQSLVGNSVNSNSVQEISSSGSSVVIGRVGDITSVIGLSNVPFSSFIAQASFVLDAVSVLGDDGSLARLSTSNNIISSRNSVSFLKILDETVIIVEGFEALSNNISGGEFSSEDLSNTHDEIGDVFGLSGFTRKDILINGERESVGLDTSDDTEVTNQGDTFVQELAISEISSVEEHAGQERSIREIEVTRMEDVSLRVLDKDRSALSSDVVDEVEDSDFSEGKTSVVRNGLDFLSEFLIVSFNNWVINLVKKGKDLLSFVTHTEVVNESPKISAIFVKDGSPSVSVRGIKVNIEDLGGTGNNGSISFAIDGIIFSGRDNASEG
jgi:hypothetical protein